MVNTGRERRFVHQNEKYSRIALLNHTRGLFVNLISLNFPIPRFIRPHDLWDQRVRQNGFY